MLQILVATALALAGACLVVAAAIASPVAGWAAAGVVLGAWTLFVSA